MRCTENCKSCSWHWSTECAQFFTTHDCTSHNQKLNEFLPYTKFCFICHIHLTSSQSTTNSSSISTTFCSKNISTTSRMQKMLSKSRWLPKHRFLHYRNLKKKLISHWQNCVDHKVSTIFFCTNIIVNQQKPTMHACSVAPIVSDYLQHHRHSLPGFSVHRILQARILEWVAMPSSRKEECRELYSKSYNNL